MIDFLIVGQGLAGSVLALQLLQRGQRVLVIGNSQAPSASRVAAGIYNPITGRYRAKTWLADELFPYLTQFYREAEQVLGVHFLHPMPIFRPFLSEEDSAAWQAKEAIGTDFVAGIVASPSCSAYDSGGLELKQGGYLSTKCFLDAARAYLTKQGAYLEADFSHDQLHLGEAVCYQGLKAHRVIFCEGPQVCKNPFFNTLPFRPVKGELLHVTLQQPLDMIYNSGVFVVPQPRQGALVGATYDWQDLSWVATAKGRQHLETQLRRTFCHPYAVQDQRAGIRPATFDRRPFIGLHPQRPQVGIFNGLGTKGISLAPYMAHLFANHLLTHTPLPAEVGITRGARGTSGDK